MRLSKEDIKILSKVLNALENQFDDKEGAFAEYCGCSNNHIFIKVKYDKGEPEEMKLRRSELTSEKSIEEIAKEVS
jgi:hypothetical protein